VTGLMDISAISREQIYPSAYQISNVPTTTGAILWEVRDVSHGLEANQVRTACFGPTAKLLTVMRTTTDVPTSQRLANSNLHTNALRPSQTLVILSTMILRESRKRMLSIAFAGTATRETLIVPYGQAMKKR